MADKEATPRCGNNCGANKRPGRDDMIIQQMYERGSLMAGLLMAAAVGSCMVHWAVM